MEQEGPQRKMISPASQRKEQSRGQGVGQGRFVLPWWGRGASKKGFEQGLEGIGVWSGGGRAWEPQVRGQQELVSQGGQEA